MTQYIGYGGKKIVAFSPNYRQKIFILSAAGGLDKGRNVRNPAGNDKGVTDIYKKFTKL